MRVCSTCQTVYQGDERVCPDDGTTLQETSTSTRAFATTAIGPGDVRDTPIAPPLMSLEHGSDGPDPLIGQTLRGRYLIEKRLGEGGMGVVYVAEHINLKKRVAIKVLLTHVAKQRSAVDRLKQEAIAASRIEHDNIVSVYDCEETEDGNVFIAMELLKGEDLASVIGRGPLPIDRALHIVYQICRALGSAHTEGIVHRDLKPENVFITLKGEQDFVKILDFGISKIKSAEADQVRMTKTGQLVGTPLYMSPEQAKGETDLDHRTDIYALGVMLYEMLTGVTPFRGENYFQVIWQHANEPPEPLRKRNPNVPVPDALEAVVQKALSKTRETRFQSMGELEAALAQAVPSVEPPPAYLSRPSNTTPVAIEVRRSMPTPERKGSALWIAVGAAVLAASGLGVWLAMRPPTDTTPVVDTTTTVAPDPPPPPGPGPDTGTVTDPAGGTGTERDPAPTSFAVAFDSTPQNAEVRLGDRVLGRTPCTAVLAPGEFALEARFVLRGYVDGVTSFVPAPDANIAVRLRPIRRPSGDPGDPGNKAIKGWN